ncbi:2OG-Fe(II) oxygenase family protein [Lichenicola cladoniae]|nr:2OG-Fe(II) oxygenase [Lichenicola cladoniae]
MPDSLTPMQDTAIVSLSLDYAGFARPVATDPFPHIVIPRFVPPASLQAVLASLPDIPGGGSYPPSALRLRGAAAELIRELEGPMLRQAIATRFDLDLDDSLTMLTMRGRTREKDGQIHTDSTAKLVTILLYLNPATADWAKQDGCLRLLRGPDDLEDYAVEVPPVDGTLLAFPNGPTTYHGHRTFVGRRYAIQLNYMASGAKARHELRRHKLSALVKRFTPA